MAHEFDFDEVPTKIFADSVSIRVINGLLHIAIQSGQSTACYLLPLSTAKQLGKGMRKLVEEMERKNNVVFDDRLPHEPMLSPWTTKKPEEDGPQH